MEPKHADMSAQTFTGFLLSRESRFSQKVPKGRPQKINVQPLIDKNHRKIELCRNSWRLYQFRADADDVAALIYLQQQWGFDSKNEAIRVAVQYLASETQRGLRRIDLQPIKHG